MFLPVLLCGSVVVHALSGAAQNVTDSLLAFEGKVPGMCQAGDRHLIITACACRLILLMGGFLIFFICFYTVHIALKVCSALPGTHFH